MRYISPVFYGPINVWLSVLENGDRCQSMVPSNLAKDFTSLFAKNVSRLCYFSLYWDYALTINMDQIVMCRVCVILVCTGTML